MPSSCILSQLDAPCRFQGGCAVLRFVGFVFAHGSVGFEVWKNEPMYLF